MLSLFGRFSCLFLVCSSILFSSGTFEKFQTIQIKDSTGSDFFENQQWNSYEPLPMKKLYEVNKPKSISSLKKRKIKAVGPKIRIVLSKRKKYKTITFDNVKKDISIDFFSTILSFNIPDRLTNAKFYPQTQKGIGNFFRTASYTEYSYLISEIEKIKKEMNLNDWGLYILIDKISNKIFSNKDNSKLFTWFILHKMDYSIRAGIVKKHILLVFKTKQSINYTQCYKIDGKLFYSLDSEAEKGVLYTYLKDSVNATKLFDMSLMTLPNLNLDINTKKLIFREDNNEFIVEYKYNKNLIDFMATYPHVQSDVFLNAPLDDISYQSIGKSFKEYLDRKKASIAINFILHFVQNTFKYQNDLEQFSKEKFMFAQETLYYDKSDAEDRVSLFSYFIRKFFSFGVIGVKYKDHMTTGLLIPIIGDSVSDGKRKYIISDPTYTNANIGENISKYKLLKPLEFIKLK